MINGKLASLIRDDIKGAYFVIFVFVMFWVGIFINFFEPYSGFELLFPVLIIMLTSTAIILKIGLIKLKNFEEECPKDEKLSEVLTILFTKRENSPMFAVYVAMIVIYFVCLYKIQFFSIDLMGIYILFLGGGTFFIALISYEIYVRSTLVLQKISKDNKFLNGQYNQKNPEQTSWLLQLFHLCQIFRTASLVIGVLFVFENSMICIVNFNDTGKFPYCAETSLVERMSQMSLEFWFIWVFALLAIGLAFPILAFVQSLYVKRITTQIHQSFKEKILNEYTEAELYQNPDKFAALFFTMQNVERTVTKVFMPKKLEGFVRLLSTFLTCAINFITLWNLFS